MANKEWWNTLICRTCAVEQGIKRASKWAAVGPCPVCGKRSILFVRYDRQRREAEARQMPVGVVSP